jgi:hypothetical protein
LPKFFGPYAPDRTDLEETQRFLVCVNCSIRNLEERGGLLDPNGTLAGYRDPFIDQVSHVVLTLFA